MKPKTFFIAGTMQGSRGGSAELDQSYREQIAAIIHSVMPDAEVICPKRIMRDQLAGQESALRQSHAALGGEDQVWSSRFDAPLLSLTAMFHQLVNRAAGSDVCIAYLPGHEASMGTACEMFAAWRSGKTVIAITEMRQNLAVLSCSTVILPTLADLRDTLQDGSIFSEPTPAIWDAVVNPA